jgi:exopolyphosphatase/guanosine-5'-triphosphate,3'-diphosphate pyrophosphatase
MIIESKSIDRKKIKGLIPMRSEMIVMSVIIINFILKNIGIQNIKYSKFSLKEGLLDRILKNNYK